MATGAMIAAGALTLAVLMAFFEALRRSHARDNNPRANPFTTPWALTLAVGLPLFFAVYIWRGQGEDCENLLPPFALIQQDLNAAQSEIKRRLRTCGSTQARWNALQQIEAAQDQAETQALEDLL